MIRFLKAALFLAKFHPWVNEPVWEADDAKALTKFFETPTGVKLKLALLNIVLRGNETATRAGASDRSYACGVAAGQANLVAQLSTLANDTNFTAEGEETDPQTS